MFGQVGRWTDMEGGRKEAVTVATLVKVGNLHHSTDQASQGSIGRSSRRNMAKRKLFT